ncbi:MAG: hypothetical protein EAZ62_05990 [Sphingobacteriia bacterium]|nr:MAG: hypothetical protein EAZ62_05990 [Sphingobacteriia bacterium]
MRTSLLVALLGLAHCFASAQKTIKPYPDELLVTPEKSNFEKTTTHGELLQFLDRLAARSPYLHRIVLGKSHMGKEIPLVILANPKITSAAEAKASGKPVVYVQGNIHAGEVEGKEIIQQLLRSILLGPDAHLLDNQILVFVPMYNTDGNDKMAKGLRPTQENSPLETGERENGQGLDLNRDGIKTEAPETRALMDVILNGWDPQMMVDLHTTNGSWHGYSLTWAPGYLSAGEAGPYHYVNDKVLPSITQNLDRNLGLKLGPFGDFTTREGWPPKRFFTYNHHPRYLINQMGLRNRMSILSEAFAHERFYQRMHSTYAFVHEILSWCNQHAKEVWQINAAADKAAMESVLQGAGKTKKGVRFKMVAQAKPLAPFRSYEFQAFTTANGNTQWNRTGRIVNYDSVPYYADFKDTLAVTLPRGYVIPAAFAAVAQQVKQLGGRVDTLRKATVFVGEEFRVEQYTKAKRAFEGHNMASAEGVYAPREYKAAAGDFLVDLAQPLANLLFYALEPQSDDGLLVWNFYDGFFADKDLTKGPQAFPVFRYFSEKNNLNLQHGKSKKQSKQ